LLVDHLEYPSRDLIVSREQCQTDATEPKKIRLQIDSEDFLNKIRIFIAKSNLRVFRQ